VAEDALGFFLYGLRRLRAHLTSRNPARFGTQAFRLLTMGLWAHRCVLIGSENSLLYLILQRVLTRTDRLYPVLTMELLQFYYSRLPAQLGMGHVQSRRVEPSSRPVTATLRV
jgi:hypothetical protein